MIFRKKQTAIGAAAILVAGSGTFLVLTSNFSAMYPAYSWRIQGSVLDASTNGLVGVKVVASGEFNFTLANLIFGTRSKTYHLETDTDDRGHFLLSFNASQTCLTFRKSGYAETNLNFVAYEGRTDPPFSATTQNLTVVLQPLPGVLGRRPAGSNQ